ncbi:MAG TPA: methyltransferase domain-containing protein [Pseudonocardiaceae bacterium]
MAFLVEFLRHPRRTGALLPSSPSAVRALLDGALLDGAEHVVELGPGTGAVTAELSRRLSGRARLVAVEVNPLFAERLRQRFSADQVDVVCDSAARLDRIVAGRGFGKVDRVISGLPWTVMSPATQREILEAVTNCLAPDGRFSTLMYLHRTRSRAAREFVALLREYFTTVERGPTTWTNLPPLLAYHCSGPRRGQR